MRGPGGPRLVVQPQMAGSLATPLQDVPILKVRADQALAPGWIAARVNSTVGGGSGAGACGKQPYE
jgi:hypothetical protein